jgi:hypothetical protein
MDEGFKDDLCKLTLMCIIFKRERSGCSDQRFRANPVR